MANRSFDSISAFVAFMEARIAGLPAAQKHALEKASEVVLKEAKSYPGEYQDGWAPLAETTLNGFQGFPGKVELGYAPPDNPLLRTGEMRDSYAKTVVSEHAAAVGSNEDTAYWHELGTPRMPARPVLKLAATRKEAEVHKIIAHAVIHQLGGG